MDFSIIIPIYNTPRLCNIIQNIVSSDITKYNYEIIIVDDGSGEHYFELYKKATSTHPNVQYYYLGDKNGKFRAGEARNIGVEKSRHSTLVFLDQDSFIHKNYFSLIEKKYSGGLLTGNMLGFNNEPKQMNNSIIQSFFNYGDIKIEQFKDIRDQDLKCFGENFGKVSSTNMIIEKHIFISCGGFDKKMIGRGFEDVEFGYRIYLLGERICYDNSLSILNLSPNLYDVNHQILCKAKIETAIQNLIYIYKKHSTPEIKKYMRVNLPLFQFFLKEYQ